MGENEFQRESLGEASLVNQIEFSSGSLMMMNTLFTFSLSLSLLSLILSLSRIISLLRESVNRSKKF